MRNIIVRGVINPKKPLDIIIKYAYNYHTMIIRITMKDPDGVGNSINDFVNNMEGANKKGQL